MKNTPASCALFSTLVIGLSLSVSATPVAYWTYDSSILADTITGDGAQDLRTSGNDQATVVQNADVPGSTIFDPLSSTFRGNSNSVIMTGDRTLTGGNQSDNGIARLETTGTDLQGSNESFTFETFMKVATLSLNNGTVSIGGQYSGAGGAGGTNVGWLPSFRPNDGTPDTTTAVDLADGDNTNDATLNVPWSPVDPTDGDWYHHAWVYDHAAGSFSHYVDYELAGSGLVDTSSFAFDRNNAFRFGVRFIANVNTEGATSEVTLLLDETRYSTSALATGDFLVAVPEPQSLALVVLAGLGLLMRRRR